MILFKNCSVLPELMDGFSEAKCDILTDGKRIKGIYKCGECPFDSETVIDEGYCIIGSIGCQLPGYWNSACWENQERVGVP